MRVLTLFKFLIGSRSAIEIVARHPMSLPIGFLFVLSAGLAREYDQEYLIGEPWHVLIPLGFSILASTLLATIFWLMPAKEGTRRPRIDRAWKMFLACFWMIAPMAWLYAIPFERIMTAGDSTRANLTMLGLVATWRVILMTRVVSVIIRIHPAAAFMVIMLFADTLVLTLLSIVPLPLFNIMGGIRLSESEQVIASMAFQTQILGMLSWPVWLLGSLIAFRSRPDWSLAREPLPEVESGWLRLVAVAMIAVGLLLLPFTQGEQRLRHQVETNLGDEKFTEALAIMSAHQSEDFPPHWDPPPRAGYRRQEPPISSVAAAITIDGTATWVRAVFAEKLEANLLRELRGYRESWSEIATNELQDRKYSQFEQHVGDLGILLTIHDGLTGSDRAAIQSLIDAAALPAIPAASFPATTQAASENP